MQPLKGEHENLKNGKAPSSEAQAELYQPGILYS